MAKKRQLITRDEAADAECQHTTPCDDCPFGRGALHGWLGGSSAQDWMLEARTDNIMPCHAIKKTQCAGAAIFRRHIAKSPRNPKALRLPADHVKVFSNDKEFLEHHEL